MRRDAERLQDIIEAIERIERYAQRGKEAFVHDELLQTWVVHHIQIIGEAARKLSDELRARDQDIPWPEIVAMRNVLVHDYFGIDVDEVWSTVEEDLPGLKRRVRTLLADDLN
jgi:uncharacterized protein with HEPN domain